MENIFEQYKLKDLIELKFVLMLKVSTLLLEFHNKIYQYVINEVVM